MSLRPIPLLFAAALWLTGDADAQRRVQRPKAGAKTEVTFVGNSYTFFHDLPAFVRALGALESKPREVDTRMLTAGGFTLQMHLGKSGGDAPATVVRKQRPDFVVLQEQSQLPFRDPAQMDKAAKAFAKICKKARATPVWYMTWARRNDPDRQDAISTQYESVHKANGGLLAPVGRAWQILRKEHPDLVLHAQDNSHPNPKGTYVAALVIHGTIFGGDVTGYPDKLSIEHEGKPKVLIALDPAEGKLLRAAASRALADEARRSKRKRRR